jgi:hypothetical protein
MRPSRVERNGCIWWYFATRGLIGSLCDHDDSVRVGVGGGWFKTKADKQQPKLTRWALMKRLLTSFFMRDYRVRQPGQSFDEDARGYDE